MSFLSKALIHIANLRFRQAKRAEKKCKKTTQINHSTLE